MLVQNKKYAYPFPILVRAQYFLDLCLFLLICMYVCLHVLINVHVVPT